MLTYNDQSNSSTVGLLFKAIQTTLTKAISDKDINTFTPSPGESQEFDEATTSIIFDRLNDKLTKKGL